MTGYRITGILFVQVILKWWDLSALQGKREQI
jgi:hypothetical protein